VAGDRLQNRSIARGTRQGAFFHHRRKDPDRWDFARSADGATRWKGLQFPLYRWLLDIPEGEILPGWKARTPADFVYFFLPEDPTKAGISTVFLEDKLAEGMDMAVRTAERILDGEFDENPDPLTQEDPIFRALCGLSNLVSDDPEEDAE